jgi:4-amino-4-deoxy-L-arabinose transferase-like glycosyltransferase
MKLTTREKNWAHGVIVICAILPMLALFSSAGQWIFRASVWFVLLLAIANGLLWLGLAVALAVVNRAPTVGFTPVPVEKQERQAFQEIHLRRKQIVS